ncbi:hypothetical protein [uncultured Clostridium sp.]|uniref:hypothetical protein n=1 Tax=uncultured Clostridium sp. TaxID=59620 RepID=UPI0028E21289|nr:hypothetical protein [uncultured Clostridium sp.]
MNNKSKVHITLLFGVVFFIAVMVKNTEKVGEQYGYAESKANEQIVVLSNDSGQEEKVVNNSVKQSSPSRGGSSDLNKEIMSRSLSVEKSNTAVEVSNSVQTVDWWDKGTYVFSRETIAEVQDVSTGIKFKVKRTMGDNHADVETLTKEDTDAVIKIWGGFSWERRPVILDINGERYAASMSAMPHAGLDSYPAYETVDNRSGEYGTGQNLDVIKGNGIDGHMDIHFLNSTRHKDGRVDPQHQDAISKASER